MAALLIDTDKVIDRVLAGAPSTRKRKSAKTA
jgi:hypothetical protein